MVYNSVPVAVNVQRRGLTIEDMLLVYIRADEKHMPQTRNQWFWKIKDVFRLMIRENKLPAWYYDFDTLKLSGRSPSLTFIRDELIDMW